MSSGKNQFLSNSTEEESSSMSLELVVDKNTDEERQTELNRENNIYNFDTETMKDKPWLKPGADITDYFNYGFTEKTWMKYCEQQRANREFSNKVGRMERYSTKKEEERGENSSENNKRRQVSSGRNGSEIKRRNNYDDARDNNKERRYEKSDAEHESGEYNERNRYNDDRYYEDRKYDERGYERRYDDRYYDQRNEERRYKSERYNEGDRDNYRGKNDRRRDGYKRKY